MRVATPEDPASARLGESFYAFLPRTVIGSVSSAWELERVRLGGMGHSPWSARNDILGAWGMTVVLFAALVAGFGVVVLPYLLIQAVVGFSLLEVVNYLEHYGLLRQRGEDGRYERTRPRLMPTTTASSPQHRVPYPVAARELLRNTLLDAACAELATRP